MSQAERGRIAKATDLLTRTTLAAGIALNPANPNPKTLPPDSYFTYPGTRHTYELPSTTPGAGLNPREVRVVMQRDEKDIGEYGIFYYGHRAMSSDSSDITDWYRAHEERTFAVLGEPYIEALYTEADNHLINEDISQMEYANMDFAISSWDSRHDARDQFMKHLKSLYADPDWQHKNFKWSFIYEKEGFGNPSTDTIGADLDHLEREYFNEPWFLKDEEGKPVLFVYSSDADTGAYLEKWSKISKERNIRLVLKSYHGYNLPINSRLRDVDWYDYQPVHGIVVNEDSVAISPEYQREGDRRVRRFNLNEWTENTARMIISDKKWKVVISFSEAHEHTPVKPTTIYDVAVCSRDGILPQDTTKIDVLHRMIPPNPKPDVIGFLSTINPAAQSSTIDNPHA